MKLTQIAGITLGKGQGKVQLQNQTAEPIEANTMHEISLKIGESKTGVSKPISPKALIAPIGKSKNDFTLMLNQAIEPNEIIEIDFTLPITVKKDVEVSAIVSSVEAEQKGEESTSATTEPHPDSVFWWFAG